MKHSVVRRLAITVRGVVQGVGFRPFIYQAARQLGLSGWVRNESGTVQIEVQGDGPALDAFAETLRHKHPPQARIDAVEIREISPDKNAALREFQIYGSLNKLAPRPAIPADLATCPDCRAEIFDPAQRRHKYPFTNCTNCGPRWSIIRQMPYDRPRTSMAAFEMCADCRAEYENPADRRFHAQPIACPHCGPKLQLLDSQGRQLAVEQSALDQAIQEIQDGRIIALKGLGGFQLLVDATNNGAVARLRERKHRPDRPFALMFPSLEEVRRHCHISPDEVEVLTSHQAPIVLLRKLDEAAESRSCEAANGHDSSFITQHSSFLCSLSPLLSPLVAPGNPYLGVMLPYTPLHHLLMAAVGRPIVCTSGNLSEEPMAITTEDALERLGPIADVLLTHDRPIVRPVDDSIARRGVSGWQVLRRARGFAPLPIELGASYQNVPTILALGGHLKNTVGLLLGHASAAQVVLSAHVGDLDSVLSVEVFRRAADDLLEFYQAKPEAVACDLHPDYASTRHAESLAERWGVLLVRVQHHHAHVAACMAEHGLAGPVLGFAWDGTGYGSDGTVWGGEVLLCEVPAEYRRVAHLRTFPLPGGDSAAREPRRSALGLLYELSTAEAAERVKAYFQPKQIDMLVSALARRVNAPRTSSMGRLFDAVAAICGLPAVITFEGQAAMALEFNADEHESGAYQIPLVGDSMAGPMMADWGPMIHAVLKERDAGVPVGKIAARFHNALADMAVEIARRVSAPLGKSLPIVLSGGCFQNALLSKRVYQCLSKAGFLVYTHQKVPPGDGGIALGQTLVAMQKLQGSSHVSGHSRQAD